MLMMKRFKFILLFLLFPLILHAEEFIVYKIQSKNFLLKEIVTQLIKNKTNNKIKISVKDNIAYISYKSSSRIIKFHKSQETNNHFYYKRGNSHIAKLFINETNINKEVYFTLEKNGKRKIKVLLTRI